MLAQMKESGIGAGDMEDASNDNGDDGPPPLEPLNDESK